MKSNFFLKRHVEQLLLKKEKLLNLLFIRQKYAKNTIFHFLTFFIFYAQN